MILFSPSLNVSMESRHRSRKVFCCVLRRSCRATEASTVGLRGVGPANRISPVSGGFMSNVSVRIITIVIMSPSFIGIRHLRAFWSLRELGGDQGQTRALAEGWSRVDGLGTVGGEHAAVLPHAAGDGQTRLVPHGFCKCQLRNKHRRVNTQTQKNILRQTQTYCHCRLEFIFGLTQVWAEGFRTHLRV